MIGWLVLAGIIGGLGFLSWITDLVSENNKSQAQINDLKNKNKQLEERVAEWTSYSDNLLSKEKQLNDERVLFERLFHERTKNYPVVGQIWADLVSVTESERERVLRFKSRPAVRAAEEVASIKREKRELVKEVVYWRYKSQNYEAVYPWLAEELAQDIDDAVESEIYYHVYTEKEREDPVSQYISPEDFRKLNPVQRNQLALDRYWQRGKKTKWMIGKMYERYVGYLYEKDGWNVEYFGIHKRFEDLGRDIIAQKGKQLHVVQCKNWSKFKTIYENHIFQLFGTSYSLQQENKGLIVTPVFYCSTVLSDTAREFAKRLGIKVFEKEPFIQYPCIKCNVSSNGDKIYHLPFDQQYDNTKIKNQAGKFYVETVAEAERLGYRRAFHWSGNKGA